MPKVSIIIPTHDRATLLRNAIGSVVNQTFRDFEIVVVDDASTDNTEDIVRSFDDKRIRYLVHHINQGEAGSRNTGVRSSPSEFIAFLDDDDEWMPNKLEKQMDLIARSPSTVGCVYTGYSVVNKADERIIVQYVRSKRGYIFEEMFTGNWFGASSTLLLRKGCFDRVGLFDEEIVFAPDWDMWIRVSKEFEVECIEEPLAKVYIHEGRLSENSQRMAQGYEALFRKYDEYFRLHRKHYSKLYLMLGVLYCYGQDVDKGKRSFLKAMRLNPFEVRHYFNYALSLLGGANYAKIKELKEKILGGWPQFTPHV